MKKIYGQHLYNPRLKKFIKAGFEAKILNDMLYEQEKKTSVKL